MLRVDLCKTEYLRVRQRSAQFLLHVVQVLHLLLRQRQSLLLVIFLKVLHVLDGLGLDVHGEYVLVQPLVHALQHGVVLSLRAFHGEILLNARDALYGHVLGYLHRVGAPGSNHLPARSHEVAADLVSVIVRVRVDKRCVIIQPAQSLLFLLTGLMVHLSRYDVSVRCLEE